MNINHDPKSEVEGKVGESLKVLSGKYAIIGKWSIRSWKVWLIIGLVAGMLGGVIYVANKNIARLESELSSAGVVGTLSVATAASPINPGASYMVAGDTGQTVAAWKFTANNIEDLKVIRIKAKQVHVDPSAAGDLQNTKLFAGSSQVGATFSFLTDPNKTVAGDEYVIFENPNGLFTVPKGGTVMVTLKTDIGLAASGKALKFRISNDATHTALTDISAKGVASATFALGSATANYDGNIHTVVNTKPTFSLHNASPSGTLIPGNVEVIRFNITAHTVGGVIFDGVKHNIRFAITENGTGGTGKTADLFDAATNTIVATQLTGLNLDTVGYLDFKNVKTTIPAGQTKTYYVRVSLGGYAAPGSSFQLKINNAAADLSWSDGRALADISNADISNIGLPVSGYVIATTPIATAGTLSVAMAASPDNPNAGYVISGGIGQKVAAWKFTANNIEDLKVTRIKAKQVHIDPSAASELYNLKLFNGSSQVGTTFSFLTNPNATIAGDEYVIFENPNGLFTVPKGGTVTVTLMTDIGLAASGKKLKFRVSNATTHTALTDISAKGVASGSFAFGSATANYDGNIHTVTTAGTLSVATAASPINPGASYMVSGDTGQTVAAWRFTANNIEDLMVTRIKARQTQGGQSAPGNLQNFKLFAGSAQVGLTIPALTTTIAGDEYVIFENPNGLFTVPKGGTVIVALKAGITPAANAVFGVNGRQFKFRIANDTNHTALTDISVKGVTSAIFALGSAAASYDGSIHTVVKTRPVFAINSASPSGMLIPGNVEVIRFNITAHTGEDVTFDGVKHNIRFAITENGTGGIGNTASLFDAATNTEVAKLTGLNLDTVGYLDFKNVRTTIVAGQTKTYYVKVSLGGYMTSGNFFQLKINNTAADLSWSDGTTSADISNTNISNIGLPVSGYVLIKP